MAKLDQEAEGASPTTSTARSSTASTKRSRSPRPMPPSKFDETIEVALNLGVDPRHADQMVRGVVTLPKGTGKTVRVGVFAKGAKADEAREAGADVVGAEDLMEIVQGGTIDFDRCIATPDMMGIVGRLGKMLGPKGMMPNPKLGTVTMNVAEAVKAAKGGQIEYPRRKGRDHPLAASARRASRPKTCARNFDALVDAMVKAKPAGAKGKYVKKIAVSSTMGPGIKVDTESWRPRKARRWREQVWQSPRLPQPCRGHGGPAPGRRADPTEGDPSARRWGRGSRWTRRRWLRFRPRRRARQEGPGRSRPPRPPGVAANCPGAVRTCSFVPAFFLPSAFTGELAGPSCPA